MLRPSVVPVKVLWILHVKTLEFKTQIYNSKEFIAQSKWTLAKETRQDKLSPVQDSHNHAIVGQGSFDICKLMSLSVSGESVREAVQHFTESTKNMSLQHIYYIAFLIINTLHFWCSLWRVTHQPCTCIPWNYKGD